MKIKFYILIALLFSGMGMSAQSAESEPANYVGVIGDMRIAPSLASKANWEKPEPLSEAPKDGRASKNLVIPGKDAQTSDDYFVKHAHPMEGLVKAQPPSIVFDVNNNVGPPSDPALAVGPDHVFIVYNTGFIIYDKEGNDLTGPLNVNNIFSNGGCCDLTASYDAAADRWVISYLFVGAGAEVAVSDGPDPITADWYVYSLPQVADYNKLSVWSDGYYMTENTGGASQVWAMEREAMIAGDAGAGIQGFALPGLITSGFFSPQALNVTDDNMPAAGSCPIIYLQDDAWGGVADDHIKLWEIDVDWDNGANSTVSAPLEIVTEPFISVFDGGSFSNLVQPGGGAEIDALQATIMNQAQFRKFGSHNSAVFNFVIDADGGAGELAAIRWYELRQDDDGGEWSIEQEGTYSSPDGKNAWHASIMMDFQGNIGMGYTGMAGPDTENPTDFRVSSYYTGRYANDPSGTMTIGEELIAAGNQDIPGFRYGDYSKIDIDPNQDKQFWFINEYMNNGGADVVGVFQIASDFENDLGVISIDAPETGALTAAEEVTITIFNYGLNDASGFDVSYQVDGGITITEPFVGVIGSTMTAQHTFGTTTDMAVEGQTYSITASTVWADDEFMSNDSHTEEVTHLSPTDVGVTAINSPVSGSELGATEAVTITIENFGSSTQTSIPVYYTLDGGTPVQETYTGSIPQGGNDTYTFAATIDLSVLGDYVIVAGTEMEGDADMSNDDTTADVSKFICQPQANCTEFNDGTSVFDLADQNLNVDCSETGYTDNTDIIFNFVLENNPFVGNFQVGFDNTTSVLWIDFNDNFTFEDSEVVAVEAIATADTDTPFEIDFSDIPDFTAGEHLMRLRGIWGVDLDDMGSVACDDIEWGRTNDYTANISGAINVQENDFSPSNLVISTLDDNQFLLNFTSSSMYDKLPVNIINSLGQNLAYYSLANNGSGYSKTIDMSYVAPGVYFIKVGNDDLNIIRRIVVK